MSVLAIDTASTRLQLALLRAGQVDVFSEDMAQGQAERIFPAIADLVERNGVGYGDLTRLVCTTGPGSFTGLRIGLSAARGLGLALQVPVLGVPSLLALSLAGPPGPHAVLLDARRGEAYVQLFGGPGLPDSPPLVVPMAEADELAAGLPVIGSPFVDMAALAVFAATADPPAFPAVPAYLRGADAKPQDKARIARRMPP